MSVGPTPSRRYRSQRTSWRNVPNSTGVALACSANSGGLKMTSFNPTRRDLLKLTAATGGALAAGPFVPRAAPEAAAQGTNAAPAPLNVVLRINGTAQRLAREPRTTPLQALGWHLPLTGSHKGCRLGQSRDCTAL